MGTKGNTLLLLSLSRKKRVLLHRRSNIVRAVRTRTQKFNFAKTGKYK